jgi:hypothetical protein
MTERTSSTAAREPDSPVNVPSTPSGSAPDRAVLTGRVEAAPPGLKGFDADVPLSAEAAQAFRARGYQL